MRLDEWMMVKPLNLNLGCGNKKLAGYCNIDISPKSKADVVYDLSKSIPFPQSSVDKILCAHFIEHLEDTIHIMNEIWRVCKDGAIVEIIVPHQSSRMAFADPTHKRIFNEESFGYFCSNGEHYWIHEIYGIKCNFNLESQKVKKDKRYGDMRVTLKAIK